MRALALRVGVAALAVGVMAPTIQAQRMERGSYLRKPALSRQQLINQMRRDPIVAARYTKHFRMSENEVVRYFSTLRTSRLKEGGRYLVWHVEPDGTIETKWLNLKKGTEVFVDETGRPILKLNCGNPLVDRLVAQRKPPVVTPTTPPPVIPVEETFVAETPPEIELVPPPMTEVPEVAFAPPPMVTPETGVVVPPPAVTGPPPAVRSGGGGFNGLPLLLLAPFAFGGGGGGGQPIPEPGTIFALGAGALALVARRRKKPSASA